MKYKKIKVWLYNGSTIVVATFEFYSKNEYLLSKSLQPNFLDSSTQFILYKSRISAVANWYSFVQLLPQFAYVMKQKSKKITYVMKQKRPIIAYVMKQNMLTITYIMRQIIYKHAYVMKQNLQ